MKLEKLAIIPGILFASLLLFLLSNLIFSPELVARASSEVTPTPGIENRLEDKTEKDCSLPVSYPPGILQWCGWIEKYANENEIPANLVAAVMLQESGGDSSSYSSSGAVGLMQVMPSDGISASFMCASGPCFSNRPSMAELLEPEFNIKYGVQLLAGLIGREGNIRDGLMAYGPFNVGYYYADKVLAILENYN